jgi:hypothetical protein
MEPVSRSEILDIAEYERRRKTVRAEIMALKDRRRISLDPVLTLLFENRRTVWYQIQEMMRAERMVDEDQIREELKTYAPLVPGAGQWKATLYIEIPDLEGLKRALPRLVGIEHAVYARVGERRVPAQGEEGRSREDYTSTVHYLTFDVPSDAAEALRAGAPLRLGVDHPEARSEVDVPESLRRELLADLLGE